MAIPPQSARPQATAQAAPQAASAQATAGQPQAQVFDQYDAMRQRPTATSDIGFSQQIQNVLLSRINAAAQQDPNFGKAIDDGVTKPAALELAKILPELNPVFKAIGLFDDQNAGGDQDLTGAGADQSSAQGAPAQQTTTPQPGSDDEDDDQNQNPLVSQGLVG